MLKVPLSGKIVNMGDRDQSFASPQIAMLAI